jgi:hypothetical protein
MRRRGLDNSYSGSSHPALISSSPGRPRESPLQLRELQQEMLGEKGEWDPIGEDTRNHYCMSRGEVQSLARIGGTRP